MKVPMPQILPVNKDQEGQLSVGQRSIGDWWQLGLIALVFASRFGVLPPNFSPVGSLGFLHRSLWPLLLVTFGFDWWHGGFYSGFQWTYLGFLGYWVLGRVAGERWRRQLFLMPAASFLFFLLSNFGVWWHWYPRSIDGLLTCYTMALPFYRNTLLGDLVFGWGWLIVQSFSRFLVGARQFKIGKLAESEV